MRLYDIQVSGKYDNMEAMYYSCSSLLIESAMDVMDYY